MNLPSYFESVQGLGIMATASKDGRTNAAIYARPHVLSDGKIAFIMAHRLTHHNLQSNPYATYIFKEEGPGYKGIRLYLKKVGEDTDTETVKSLCRRPRHANGKEELSVVYFTVEKALSLVGPEELQVKT
jgi:hypothetical protein